MPPETTSNLPDEDRPALGAEALRGQESGAGTGSAGSTSLGGRSGTGGQAGGATSTSTPNTRSSSPTSTTGGSPNNQRQLRDAEETPDDTDDDQIGDGYDDSSDSGRKTKRRKKWRRRATIGGGLLAGGVTGAVMIAGITSGPGQAIQLSHILQRPSFGSQQTSRFTMNRLWRFYRSGNYGETRVGRLSSKTFGKTINELSDIGIEFQRDSLDHVKSTTIDTGKLQKAYPELEGMNDAQREVFLKERFSSLSDAPFARIGTGSDVHGTKFAVNTRDFGIGDTRNLIRDSLAPLEDGKTLTGIKFRALAKFFNLPNLFHPEQKLSASQEKKSTTAYERKAAAQAEEERLAALEKPAAEAAAPAESSLKDKITGKNLAASALLVTAGMCLVRDVAGDVVAVNFGSIVIPATVQAVDKTAVGEQAEAGQDITAGQVGGVVDGFTDSNGQNIWQGMGLEALGGMPLTGVDIPHAFQQAFAGGTTAQGIKQYLGGGGFGDVACSTPGKIAQGVFGVALIVSGFFDAGASWGAKAAAVGAEGANAAATAGVITVLQDQFVKLLANKSVVPKILSGPLGGNLFAYGARSAANIAARATGGIPLSAAAAASLDKQQQIADQQHFHSESFFARTFDTSNYQSLAGRLADSLNPSLTQNVASATTGLMNISSILPHSLSSLLIPKAQAANNPYDWGFPLYGVPSDVINDPQYTDPYANADKVAAQLDAGDPKGYIGQAKTCFGVDINKDSGDWNVTPSDLVNPNSDDYANAHCGDLSDPDWKRMILFVSDTETMEAAACYQGDNDSCTNVGYSQAAADSGGSETPTATAGATIDMNHLYDSSVDVACAPNTKDLGIQDGYTEGKKVKIRICAVSNMSSSGEESQGGYGVSGADGKAIVNSRVSGAVYAMVAAAKTDHITLSATSAFRTMAHQQALCPCDGVHVAIPGTSNHQMGLAIDFDGLPSTPAPGSGPVWDWLEKNASSFGYKNYPQEAWHWSPTGS